MKPLSQYPVSFPYGATTPPYSPAHPHSGEDRRAPANTPIIVGNTIIGYVGTTGASTGNHCHIQEAKLVGNKWVFQDPKGRGLNITGEVMEVGYDAKEKGNYVRILAENGLRYSYFHMISKPTVVVNQLVKAVQGDQDMNATKEQLTVIYSFAFPNQPINYDWVKAYTGRDMNDALNALRDDASRQTYITNLVNDADKYRKGDAQTKISEIRRIVQ